MLLSDPSRAAATARVDAADRARRRAWPHRRVAPAPRSTPRPPSGTSDEPDPRSRSPTSGPANGALVARGDGVRLRLLGRAVRAPASSRSSQPPWVRGTPWRAPRAPPPSTSVSRSLGVGPAIWSRSPTSRSSPRPTRCATSVRSLLFVDSDRTSWNLDPQLLRDGLDAPGRCGPAVAHGRRGRARPRPARRPGRDRRDLRRATGSRCSRTLRSRSVPAGQPGPWPVGSTGYRRVGSARSPSTATRSPPPVVAACW